MKINFDSESIVTIGEVNTFMECQSECATNPLCNYWSWKSDICYLKSEMGQRVMNEDFVSGRKSCDQGK